MNKKPTYVDIAPAIPLSPSQRQLYTYLVEPNPGLTISKFQTVTAPFGKRFVSGVVINAHHRRPPYQTRKIKQVFPLSLTKKQITFARWIADTMQGGLGYTLRLFKPPAARPVGLPPPPNQQRLGQTATQTIKQLQLKHTALIMRNLDIKLKILNQIISHYLAEKRQVLTLVPEKNLLSGPGASYTASTKQAQQAFIWRCLRQGKALAVRGTQKSLFLPFTNLGLIIIEEEQLPAHKLWDQYPRLSNIYAGQALAKIHNCPILYTSSFPSWRLHYLKKRNQVSFTGSAPQHRPASFAYYSFSDKLNKYILPRQLLAEMGTWYKQSQSILIFYNRRNAKSLHHLLSNNFGHNYRRQIKIATSSIFTSRESVLFDRIIWLGSEASLSYPDYRSVERSFITLARLRGLLKDQRRQVIIAARHQNTVSRIFNRPLSEIIAEQLSERTQLNLPPSSDIMQLAFQERTESGSFKRAIKTKQLLKHQLSKAAVPPAAVQMIGPYQNLSSAKSTPSIYYLQLRGPLGQLKKVYRAIPADSFDLDPARIL